MIVMQQARRICWPNPDATCLEGGCGYCNDNPFRALTIIRAYAESAGQVRNRGNDKTQDAVDAYNYGYRHRFFNAETRGNLTGFEANKRMMATPKKRTFPAHQFVSHLTLEHEPTGHFFRQEEQMIVVAHEGVDVATFTTDLLAIPGAHLTEAALRKAAQQWLKEQDATG
jgi:hypothetical protein